MISFCPVSILDKDVKSIFMWKSFYLCLMLVLKFKLQSNFDDMNSSVTQERVVAKFLRQQTLDSR